jgi:hypothetical protein
LHTESCPYGKIGCFRMVRSWQGMALNKPIGSVLKDRPKDGRL